MARIILLRIASAREFVAARANSWCLRELASQACGFGNRARDRVRCERDLHFPRALWQSACEVRDACRGSGRASRGTSANRHADSQLSPENSCFKSAHAQGSHRSVSKMQLGAPIAHTSNRPEAHSRYSDSDADRFKQWCKKAEKMQLFVLRLPSAPRIEKMTAITSFQL